MKVEFKNVIKLEEKKSFQKQCRHKYILVDRDLDYVTCKNCGEKLNPMFVLRRMCQEESRYVYERRFLDNWRKLLLRKSKTKCEHCGKFTKVNIKMSSGESQGFESVKDE